MNWLVNTLASSIGKKSMMAVSGLCFCGFLTVHLIGNLTVYGGKDYFNAYVEHLHAYDPLITVAEWGLLTLALIHVLTGALLYFGNLKARPVRYYMDNSAGGRTIGSRTMPYTGLLLAMFIILHLLNFHFVDRGERTVYELLTGAFSQPHYVLIYMAAVAIAVVHISHGFWSAFQTFGANHPKYMPIIKGLGIAFTLAVGVGFGFIPLYISLTA